jgi:hypothetical protein
MNENEINITNENQIKEIFTEKKFQIDLIEQNSDNLLNLDDKEDEILFKDLLIDLTIYENMDLSISALKLLFKYKSQKENLFEKLKKLGKIIY